MAERFKVSTEGEVAVLELELPEELDSDEFGRLNEALLGLVANRAHAAWVLDLSHLDYAGSAVLGLMVNLRQKVKETDGRLVLCGLSERLLTVFRTCSLERLFIIRRSRPEAVNRAK